MLFISRFLTLSFRESCINSLTSPTLLLWTIHGHSHRYPYQLSSMCEQKPIGKKQHIYKRKHMKTKWPTSFLKVFEKLIPKLSKMYAFLVPSGQRTFVKTTEHPWTKTILSKGGRRKLFNPDLMNQLIRMEWVSEWVNEWAPSTDIRPLPKQLMDVNPWAKNTVWTKTLWNKLKCHKFQHQHSSKENQNLAKDTPQAPQSKN